MKPQNQAQANSLWATILVEELTRCGVEHFCIAPGGRSTPLAVAACSNEKVKAYVHQDERGLGFFALGLAKATRKPSVLICTSGTAVANFMPAIVEASQTGESLIVLSADLPWEQTATGANQGINQSRMFSNFTNWDFDFPAPEINFSWEGLVSKIDYAVFKSSSGPVQLNCRFRAPFHETNSDVSSLSFDTNKYSEWKNSKNPQTKYRKAQNIPSSKDFAEVVAMLKKAKRGVIVVGENACDFDTSVIQQLAESIQWPVICDPLSQLRLSEHQHSAFLSHMTILASDEKFVAENKPDVVLHLGGDIVLRPPHEPFVRGIHSYLNNPEKFKVVVRDSENAYDPFFDCDLRLASNVEEFCKLLLSFSAEIPHSELIQKLRSADFLVSQQIAASTADVSDQMIEPYAVRAVLENLPDNSALFIANSLSIREVDYMLSAENKNVLSGSLHGVKGIDGTFATAFGFAVGLNRPLTLIIGDTAALHDLNSLLFSKQIEIPVSILILNNDGGQIFSYVDASKTEVFEKCFVAPHGCGFEAVAEQFDISYSCPTSINDLTEDYMASIKEAGVSLLEIKTTRDLLISAQQQIFADALKQG